MPHTERKLVVKEVMTIFEFRDRVEHWLQGRGKPSKQQAIAEAARYLFATHEVREALDCELRKMTPTFGQSPERETP